MSFSGKVTSSGIIEASSFTAAVAEFAGTISIKGPGIIFGENQLELTTGGAITLVSTSGGNITIGNGLSSIRLYLPGIGLRTVEVGPENSAGTGYRTLRIAN